MAARIRSVANAEVSSDAYTEAIGSWLDDPPVLSFRQKLGAKVVKDHRALSPASLLLLHNLMSSLIDAGLTSCVVQKEKLKHGIRVSLSKRSLLLSDWNLGKAMEDGSEHIMCAFALLRILAREEVCGSDARRFPKTGGFRRRVASSDWPRLQGLMARVHVGEISRQNSLSPRPSPSLSTRPSRCMGEEELDDDGYPVIFTAASASPRSRSPMLMSPRSLVFGESLECAHDVSCDTDGWPSIFEFDTSSLDKHIEPIDPAPGRRKKQTLKNRSEIRAKTPQKKPASKSTTTPKKKPAKSRPREHAMPMVKTRLAITNDDNRRAELTGYTSTGIRVHLVTLTESRFGKAFTKHAQNLKDVTDANRLSKIEVENLRDGLL